MKLSTAQDFREAMSRLGAAVNIITTAGPAGRVGMTVSAVCSVTDTPPTLLICLRRASALHQIFSENQVLCVNILSGEQAGLSAMFAGQGALSMEQRFAGAEWCDMPSGAPALRAAAAAIDTRIIQSVEVGTHSVLMCEVTDLRLSEARSGLVYFQRQYHALEPMQAN